MAEVIVVAGEREAGELAATAICDLLTADPGARLGVATGSTPLSTYRALAARDVDASRARAFALDEYVGLPAGHPESYRYVLEREFARPVGLPTENLHVPDGSRPSAAGDEYERAITGAGGIDLQLLGIGTDGHVGFNEPGSSLASLTRVKTLTERTRSDNARFFTTPAEVPTHCVTQGIGTILRARHLVLLAFGGDKATAVADAVEGPVSASAPASAIQLHAHVTVVLDEAAASGLTRLDYYRHTWENKPSWQGL